MASEKEQNIDVTETISKAEHYVQENKKSLMIIGGAVLLVLAGYFGYTGFIVKPQEDKLQQNMFMAEYYFKSDSTDKAINGDGFYPGFKEIIETYGSAPSANLARYYLGICYLKKAQFNEAIDMLSSYDAEDDITGALALGGIGDANLELGNKDEALKYYKKATGWDDNGFTAPLYLMKQAVVYEAMSDYKSAAEIYERIKKDFPNSTEGREVAKDLARANAMLNS